MDSVRVVCLDYDGTYNLAPEQWDEVIKVFQTVFKWKVILCTYRHKEKDWHPDFTHLQDNVKIDCYFSDGRAKKQFLEELGISVDVWIDDKPDVILNDSSWPHESPELQAWREKNKQILEWEIQNGKFDYRKP